MRRRLSIIYNGFHRYFCEFAASLVALLISGHSARRLSVVATPKGVKPQYTIHWNLFFLGTSLIAIRLYFLICVQVYVLLNYGLRLQLICICVCVCTSSLSYSLSASGSFASFSFDFFLARLILRSVLHFIVEFSRSFLHYSLHEREREGRGEIRKLTAVFVFDQLFVLCLHLPHVHVKMYQRVYVCVCRCVRALRESTLSH